MNTFFSPIGLEYFKNYRNIENGRNRYLDDCKGVINDLSVELSKNIADSSITIKKPRDEGSFYYCEFYKSSASRNKEGRIFIGVGFGIGILDKKDPEPGFYGYLYCSRTDGLDSRLNTIKLDVCRIKAGLKCDRYLENAYGYVYLKSEPGEPGEPGDKCFTYEGLKTISQGLMKLFPRWHKIAVKRV